MKKILLVEDEPLIQRSLKKLMERQGAAVIAESSGKAAIKQIQSNDFDRIVCDLMLQDITGFDVLEEAKQKYSGSEIQKRFILMTAYSSPQVLEKAKSYGCEILSKPFNNIDDAISLFLK